MTRRQGQRPELEDLTFTSTTQVLAGRGIERAPHQVNKGLSFDDSMSPRAANVDDMLHMAAEDLRRATARGAASKNSVRRSVGPPEIAQAQRFWA